MPQYKTQRCGPGGHPDSRHSHNSGHWPPPGRHRRAELRQLREETRTASETFATLSVTNVFSLPSYAPAICCLLAACSGPAEPREDSNNPHSLLLVSVTSLQAPQQLHFHLWLLRTRTRHSRPCRAAGSLHPALPSSPIPPSTE